MVEGKTLVAVSIGVCVIAAVVAAGAYVSGISGSGNLGQKTLKISLIPAEDQLDMLKKLEPVRKYLERELGMNVETFTATDYSAVIEAMRSKKIDIAYFGPFSYVLAAKRANAEAIVTGGTDSGKVATYPSLIITHKDCNAGRGDSGKRSCRRYAYSRYI